MTNSSTEWRLGFEPDPHRLIAGITGPEPETHGSGGSAGMPIHRFRVLRPRDLVVFDVVAHGLELRHRNRAPALVALSSEAWLQVRFSFQHLGERAFYQSGATKEDGSDDPTATPETPTPPPIPSRTAEPSRLVFEVPAGEHIEYSVEGVLRAMARLPLRVAPLAVPRPGLQLESAIPQRPEVLLGRLPGGLNLFRSEEGQLLIRTADDEASLSLPADRRVIAEARRLRTAVSLLAGETAIDVSGRLRGRGVFDVDELPAPIPAIPDGPRPPTADETAIEAPFRLILSPSVRGGFTHAFKPVPAREDDARVELWHTRLGVRELHAGGPGARVLETSHAQRIVRAIWARDRNGLPMHVDPSPEDLPFRQSLTPQDRSILVRQSSDPAITIPRPIEVQRLALSSLGATLALHGRWDTSPYTSQPHNYGAILSWDHIAPFGRDQFVRVAYPGYLFPFGHRCALIKITERKIQQANQPVAYLRQRKFLIVSQPLRSYGGRDLPFRQVEIQPLVTPDIDDPLKESDLNPGKQLLFWPAVNEERFAFTLVCTDHEGRRVRLQTPLLFVAEQLPSEEVGEETIKTTWTSWTGQPLHAIQGHGQQVAFAESDVPGETSFETQKLYFSGTPGPAGSSTATPMLTEAEVVLPAMRHLAPQAPAVKVSYTVDYLKDGFGGSNATAQLFLQLKDPGSLTFSSGTDRCGGFLQPDLPIRGLSRKLGTVGELTKVNAGQFIPAAYLDGALPKLFGLFKLTDLLETAGLAEAPRLISEQLDVISGLLSDLAALEQAVAQALDRLAKIAKPADKGGDPTENLRTQAKEAATRLQAVQEQLLAHRTPLLEAITKLLQSVGGSKINAEENPIPDEVKTHLSAIGATVDQLQQQLAGLLLPAALRAQLERPVRALQPVLNSTALGTTLASLTKFVSGLLAEGGGFRARYQWQPRLKNVSLPASDRPLLEVDPHGLTLSLEARAAGEAGVSVDVLAELRDFNLHLFPDAPLVRLQFRRLAFRSASGRKTEVDVVFGGIEFVGVLSFVQTLQELIPFDAFSDPPYLDVSSEGVTAGFDLALPATAIGVFALQNISLGADARVPFLGNEALSFGFNFCTREKPFCLTVMALGGGGFVAMRLTPRGLVLLEMALEAGACLAITLGVASGSVSAMVGIYLRLEQQAGSLTGYFRIRGEVDVLSLISASITLELALTYDFNSGKMVGRASIEIEVEVFLLSFSVTVTCEKRLAGANGDPTFADVMNLENGTSLAWTQYCGAFAAA